MQLIPKINRSILNYTLQRRMSHRQHICTLPDVDQPSLSRVGSICNCSRIPASNILTHELHCTLLRGSQLLNYLARRSTFENCSRNSRRPSTDSDTGSGAQELQSMLNNWTSADSSHRKWRRCRFYLLHPSSHGASQELFHGPPSRLLREFLFAASAAAAHPNVESASACPPRNLGLRFGPLSMTIRVEALLKTYMFPPRQNKIRPSKLARNELLAVARGSSGRVV